MFRTHSFVLLAVLALMTLTQCTSSPKRPSPAEKETVDVTDKRLSITEDKSAENWLEEARQAPNEVAQHSALVRAANAFQNQQQWQKAAAILSQLSPQKITHYSQKYYHLARARWAAEREQWSAVQDELIGVPTQFNQREFRSLALQLLSRSAYQQQNYWQALVWQVDAQHYSEQANADTIWSIASRVTPSQLPDERPSNITLAGWWRLIDYHHQAMAQPEKLPDYLVQWQKSFANHDALPLVNQWQEPSTAAETTSETQPQDTSTTAHQPTVAVLLPLSGRYQQQGKAVRDGVIARVAEVNQLRVVFIDTAANDIAAHQKQIETLNPVAIVGPLLKENVTAWVKQPLATIPQVYLNQIDSNIEVNLPTSIFFALSPEAEAEQAARHMSQIYSDKKNTLIIAADHSSGHRMVEAFKSSWDDNNEKKPVVSYFSERSDMQSTVESALELTDSQKRIRAVKIAAGKIIVDAQERSRRDIASVYLPGNLQQTRLLKPFIDVSVSPFAEPIQVYASSASHELQNRLGDPDLNGIIFSDIPWLIKNEEKRQLLQQWLELRNGWDLSLARLTAMGYDSISLMRRLKMMQRMPGLTWSGPSGDLHLDNNAVQRQLIWATFSKENVTLSKEQADAGSGNG
ncbi:penicillin-binding protein activator [Idiomarina sp. HP20-50]|uniref:penicillin-binding protein activator n=1 Tax=Idiomarina sp. HP20-50 TaxID=3070813 RepID=UPI00294AB76E|nr:penicillin-binding protein activator [Idiomarina sp. HP20-50]MDV6315996.1 penicillin-binding protein activator [Idiomarina sp. HP20-50]